MEKKQSELCLEILKALINKGEAKIIRQIFNSMIPKWQKKIIKGLEEIKEKETINILIGGYNV